MMTLNKGYWGDAAAAVPSPNLYTGISLGTGGNNSVDYSLGFDFEVTGSVTVDYLCRAKNSGNSGTHTIYLVQRTPSFAILDSVSVNLSTDPTVSMGGVDWVCKPLSSPILLTNGEKYAIMSAESNGGDTWYSDDTTVSSFFSGVTIDGSCFDTDIPPDQIQFSNFGAKTYGPVNAVVH